jgi:hypothetical protein
VTFDELELAIAALRAHRQGDSVAASVSEAKILERVRKHHQRLKKWRWALPLAAVFVASTVWAAGQAAVRASVRAMVYQALHGDSPPAPKATAKLHPVVTAPTPSKSVSVPPVPELPSEEPPLPNSLTQASSTQTSLTLSAPRQVGSNATTTAGAESPLALYRVAHSLHFEHRNSEVALIAWDRYLAVDAHGPLVLEARFNRAVCLVSLGRDAEARLALAPFANGEYGSYRRDEARSILSRLSQPATSAP